MQNIKVNNLVELKECLAAFGKNVLFRGQTEHFGTPEHPSATTSFDRHGCIPSEMLRWSRYADEVLGAFTGEHSNLPLSQAILQHYGFRSFYLDCSDQPAVSAWFAGNRYSDEPSVELCEDCDERPLFLRKKMASYNAADGVGHLYVLDRAACEKVGLTDLTAIAIEGARTRAGVQSAHLLGPLRNTPLPVECFLVHIEADCAIFREFAAEAGLVSTDSVFPPST
ncbi:FRG domain-containing protein [Sphingobium chungbukense]|uniref:FRG domain-containing protein n=1 Tax=Sphingobium chungbukense TaxID=56193 RepID=UPI000AF7D490|nr:FRG domain-containing protein [Sphingobium chungbukense]